jgi:hypothetical protein
MAILKRDDFRMNHHRASAYCLRMIFFGKPLHTFPDHALGWICDFADPGRLPDRRHDFLSGE